MLLKRTLVATPLAVALTLVATALWAGIGTSDLSITKTDGDTISLIGGSITYTITGTNDGPDDIFGATVADTFPSELSGCSWTCSASAGSSCTASGSGNISDTVNLLENGTVTYTAMCSISGSATPGSILSNTASISSPASDPNPNNNMATDDNTLLPEADLSITKTDGVTSANPGQSLNYTIVAANAGPMGVVGATVADTFPSELTGCNWTCGASAGSSCSAAGSGDLSESVNLLSGGLATFAVSCTIDPAATGTLSNTATISGVVFDATPSDQTATDADTVLMPTADLSITKTDSADPVGLGDAYSYTVTVSNAGPSDATAVVATDTLPAGVSLVSTTGCAEDPGGAPTCTLGTIAVGGMASYTINVTAPSSPGTITNSVSVTSAAAEINSGNNSASEDTTVEDVDLAITKTDSVDPVAPSGAYTYTVTVNNAGPSDATGVVVTDNLPLGVSLMSTSGCAEDPAGAPTCTLGSISSGGMASYTIDVTAPAIPGNVSNTASVTSSSPESNTGNNSGSQDTLVENADLSITKNDSADPVDVGAPYSYTVTVSNAGPSDATSVVVTDNLPAGVTLVSTSGCAEDPNGAPTCSLGTINSGGMASYTISVTAPTAGGSVTNTASVTSATFDADTGNNSASQDTLIQSSADLSITKTDGVTSATPGTTVTYTIVAANAGPSDVTGATVTDTFPTALSCSWTCVASAGSSCTATSAGNISDTVDLLSGGSATYTATCDIAASATGSLSNTATISSPVSDPSPGNESATDIDTLTPSADLSITKVDTADPVQVSSPFSYTITVDNAGPSDAVGVAVMDTLPAGVVFVDSAGCAQDPAGVPTCSLGTVVAGGSASYTVNVTSPASAGTVTNTASVAATTPDGNTSNNTTTEDTEILPNVTDLLITTAVVPSTPNLGEPVMVDVEVSNAGPSDATGVVVSTTLPTSLAFNSTVGCVEDPAGVPTCTLGAIANGDMQSFTINATVVQVDGSSGTATATSDQSDSDTSNNSASIVLVVGGVLSIPTASEWGLMVLALLLGGAALWRMRRA